MSKEFERSWRPTLHLITCIVHGVIEYYCVADHDMHKSSNQNLSVLSSLSAVVCVRVKVDAGHFAVYARGRVLDLTKQELARRGRPMPGSVFQADNTTREQRNQACSSWRGRSD